MSGREPADSGDMGLLDRIENDIGVVSPQIGG